MSRHQFWHSLMDQYPQFFSPERPDSGLVDGGIACGRGWDGILSELFAKMELYRLPPQFRITQVKQKFGELRVYHNREAGEASAIVDAAVGAAMLRSVVTCERCGEAGMREEHNRVWRTLCASCRQRLSEL